MNVDLGGNTLTNGYFAGIVVSDLTKWLIKSAAYAATAGDKIQADTGTGAFTITLPALAGVGDAILIEDAALTWNINSLIVDRNGNLLNGGSSNFTANVQSGKLSVVFCGGSIGWSVK